MKPHIAIQPTGVEGKALHFYGNNGVCVFKYLVTKDDPQRIYCLAILVINFLCFITISGCYLVINIITARSSEIVSRDNNSNQRKGIQTKISVIIFTDFICWIPLTVICFLHYGDVIDATDWYPVFSIVLLPINSVINPVLYNAKIGRIISKPGSVIIAVGGKLVAYFGGLLGKKIVSEGEEGRGDSGDGSSIEMTEVQTRRENTTDHVRKDNDPVIISQIEVESENL